MTRIAAASPTAVRGRGPAAMELEMRTTTFDTTAMTTLDVTTQRRDQMVDLTDRVRRIVEDAGVADGCVIVYVPHTTAGVTINENADPDVVHDMLRQLD